MKSEAIKIRLNADTLDEIRKEAAANMRTIAKQLEYMLKNSKEKEINNMNNNTAEKLETLTEYTRAYILDRLSEHEGETYADAWELANALTESDNISGSATYNTYKARQYIGAWFNEIGAIMDEYADQFGEPVSINAFNEPERFHCLIVILSVEFMLGRVKALRYAGDDFTLTAELIQKTAEEVATLSPLPDME